MASDATISGLASGIDWKQTVDLLMQIEYQPANRLVEKIDAVKEKKSVWEGLEGKLRALQTESQSLDTLGELLSKDADSSDTTKLSVSADSDALASTHTVEINQLAQNEIYVHDTGWADLNSTSITGSGNVFEYSYDGTTRTITLSSGATLLDLVQAINNDGSNPGIIASTIDDGGATDPIHLVLTAKEPQESNSISINDANTTIASGTFDSAGWTRTQDAQPSQIRVDGYPAGDWISRSSNTISDVLDGVTLTLKETTTSDVTVSISDDYRDIKQSITGWVDSYNEVITFIKTYTRWDEENEKRGLLMGDGNVSQIQSDLQRMVSSEIPGISDDMTYRSLGGVGIDFSAGGKLIIDSDELQEALEEDAEEVAKLFAFTSSSSNDAIRFFTKTEDTQGGSYEVVAHYLANGKLDSSANNTIGGYPATVVNDYYLKGKDGTDVEGLKVRFDDPGGGPSSVTATLNLTTGVAEMSDKLVDVYTDEFEGLFKIVKDGYDNEIESYDDQLLALERRLEQKREMLERQFLKMEEAVSQARAQANWTAGL